MRYLHFRNARGDLQEGHVYAKRLRDYASRCHLSLFFGSHAGAKRGCIFYSLACSCRELGINFFDYLSDVLNRTAALPPGSNSEAYRDLLPDRWTKE